MEKPTTAPTQLGLQSTHTRSYIVVALVVACFVVGWAANRLAPSFSANPLVRALSNAYQEVYYARVGQPGAPRVYYVYGSDFRELHKLVDVNPDLISLKMTSISNLATISIKSGAREAYELVKTTPGIDKVFSIPFFCH